jgi:hypothetical protein
MEMLINIDIDDLDQAMLFYTAALPARLSRRLFDGQVAELLGASSIIYLLAKPAGTITTAKSRPVRTLKRPCNASPGAHW